jgi:hypothetical protein
VGDIRLVTDTKIGVEILKPEPLPIKIDAYRESVKTISTKLIAKKTVTIDDPVRFATEAVRSIVDDDGEVADEPIWGCIKLTPELKFFPVVGGK